MDWLSSDRQLPAVLHETLHAWQQLVHVPTHEIMNSLTPVASLSHTTQSLIEEAAAHLPQPLYEDIAVALSAICRRADSLVQFVSSYRSLSSVPEARAERVSISRMFEHLQALIAPAWSQDRGGMASFSVQPESLELIADPGQIEQLLLNLTKNAYEATAGQTRANLEVRASLSRGGRLRLEVSVDGPGVPDANIAQIFTPFFFNQGEGPRHRSGAGAPPGSQQWRQRALCQALSRRREIHPDLLSRAAFRKLR